MKEVKEAIRALRSKAQTYEKLAQTLEHLDKFANEYEPEQSPTKRPHRHLSAAGRARISKAQKTRWAKRRLQLVHKKAS